VRALARFQRYAGLPVDGVAGAATFRALRKAPPRPSRLFFPLTSFSSAADAGRAVEITCPYGASVAAAAEGTVVFAGERPHGYGYTVVTINRTGLAILYAHLARFDVKRGETLVPGAFVGLAGWTGKRKTVTTLRIEVRLRGAQLDAYNAFFRR
jgi:murein DD-endopeptidase MepM/ murein hydrolase activator NlpD